MILSSITRLQYIPKRIISLVPSQTELLHYFNLDKEVIGLTKFCIHPNKWFTTKTKIGGTKNINIKLIKELNPDLIIANKEENVKEQIEELATQYPIWVTHIKNVQDALQMIADIGALTGKKNEAADLISKINNQFKELVVTHQPINTAYLIWKNPYMTIGADTFINNMMNKCGLNNIFADKARYPEITIEQLQKNLPCLVLLSSEPYPFKQKHVEELKKYLPDSKIHLVNGEYFSWYGSRLLQAPSYFKKLLNDIT